MTSKFQSCLNCGQNLDGSFCKNCGQKATTGRLTIWATLSGFFDKYLDLESGLLHTFVQMCLRPGTVILEYCQGKRRKYINPFGYALFSTAISVFVLSIMPESSGLADAWHQTASMLQLNEEQAKLFIEVQMESIQYVSLLTALTCIPVALLLRIFFPRREFCLAELFAFSLFVMGQVFYIDILTYPLQFYMGLGVASIMTIAIYVLATAHATLGFFGATIWNVARTTLAVLISIIAIQVLIFVGQLYYVKTTIPDVPI